MAPKVYIILGLIAVFAIGFIRIASSIRSITKSIDFLSIYRSRFIDLANSYFGSNYAAARSIDVEAYNWLTLNCNKAQREVGGWGIGEFIAPFQVYKIRNYAFISNTIPKFADGHIHQNEVNTVDHILLKRIGYFQEIEEELRSEFRNPIRWFQYGIKFLISLPARMLSWFGIINDSTVTKITSNWFFTFVSGIVGFAGFLSSIVTVLTGWEPFTKIIQMLIENMKK